MQPNFHTLLSAPLIIVLSILVLFPHAAAALAIDGENSVNGEDTGGTITLSTTLPNDIIVLDEANETGNGPNPVATISSISDTYGLTWHERTATSSPSMEGVFGFYYGFDTEVWWAYATSSLFSDTISPSFSGGTIDCETLTAFGVAGANTSNPWDTNSSLPATAINTSESYLGGTDAAPSVSLSTNEPSTMLLGFMATPYVGVDNNASPYGAGSGYGLIAYQDGDCGGNGEADSAVEFRTPVTSQSNATVSFSPAGQGWFAIGDAIQSANQCTPKSSPFGLDGSALNSIGSIGGAGSTSTQLTTTQPNDVIVALVGHYGGNSVMSDADDLNWTERATISGMDEWYAVANCPLSSDTITMTTRSGGGYTGFNVFAVSGANTNNIFDPNGGLPATSATTSVSISTSNANDFIFSAMTDYNGIASSAGAGWTEIDGSNANGGYFSEYQTVSALQSNLTASFIENYPGGEAMIGDAIEEGASQPLVGRIIRIIGGTRLIGGIRLGGSSPIASNVPNNLSIDGHSSADTGQFSGNSGLTLSTYEPNDIIVLEASNETGTGDPIATISSISDTYGLTWQKRSATSSPNMMGTNYNLNGGQLTAFDTEVWWAYATSSLSSDVITPTFSGGPVDCESLIAFGVHGANTSNPWDPNGSLPTYAINNSSTYLGGSDTDPSVSVSTNEQNAMLLGFMANAYHGVDNLGTSYDAGSGYTEPAYYEPGANCNLEADSAAEDQVVSSVQSNTTVNFTPAGQGWFMTGDAIDGAGQ